MNTPTINVTPLIDVLLVLLIIFMVVAPLKPASFKARVPSAPINDPRIRPEPNTLVAVLGADGTLKLNKESGLGTTGDPTPLTERLKAIFAERTANGDVANLNADDPARPDATERTVFIKAPRAAGYGEVARLIDAVKVAGAYPISLQIDDLQ